MALEPKFVDYLNAINASAVVQARVEELIPLLQQTTGEEGMRLFLEDHTTDDGERVFSGLTVISESFLTGAEDFLRRTQLQIMPWTSAIHYLQVTSESYNFVEAKSGDSLQTEVVFGPAQRWTLEASANNCDFLWAIVQEEIAPRLRS